MELKMSKSDVLDKFSILSMRSRFDNKIKPVFDEYALAATRIFLGVKKRDKAEELLINFAKLVEANAKIWSFEATIRDEFKDDPANQGGDLTFEAIGRATLVIREYNMQRLRAKAAIDKIFNQEPEADGGWPSLFEQGRAASGDSNNENEKGIITPFAKYPGSVVIGGGDEI